MKRYRDFTYLWEKIPNGLLYDWLKFVEENHHRWRSLLRQLTDGENPQEWQTLIQEASRKIWAMWSDTNWNGTGDSEKACFIADLRKDGVAEVQILMLVEKAETLIQQDPLRHITVYIAEIDDADEVETAKRLDAGGRRNFFRWSGLTEGANQSFDHLDIYL